MGAICCLEKAGLPLHQGSNQNDGRKVRTFSKVLKKEEVEQIKILEVKEGSFHKRKFKCALKRTACLYKKSALDGISEIEEASSEFEEAIKKSKRQARKSEKHLAFPDASAPITRKLSFAEITGNLLKRQSQISKRRQSFSSLVSTQHAQTQLCGNHEQLVEAPIPDIEEAPVFFSLVNTCHMHTQLDENYGQFVEDF
ncbi:hypothetical protein EV2_048432 [Malus domestica]